MLDPAWWERALRKLNTEFAEAGIDPEHMILTLETTMGAAQYYVLTARARVKTDQIKLPPSPGQIV